MDSSAGKGTFITFEGGDGAGKTTHLRFLASVLESQSYEVVSLREPGGTVIGEQLRDIVLDPEYSQMSSRTELLLYEAARAQLVCEVIKPALERGAVVLCDRFTDSTIAYQAYGRGLSPEFVEQVNEFVCQGIAPDRTILMMSGGTVGQSLERAWHHHDPDRLELAGESFHERVNAFYAQLAERHPERVRLVVSDEAKSKTSRKVFAALSDLFPFMNDPSICTDELFARLDVKRTIPERS